MNIQSLFLREKSFEGYEDKELITDSLDGELKQVDETHYEAVIKTPDKVYGYMMIYMALEDCANSSAGFQIAVIP